MRLRIALATVVTCLIAVVVPAQSSAAPNSARAANEMGFIGCSMAENVAQGYRAGTDDRLGTDLRLLLEWGDL
jgi:hypothetical protein